MVCTAVLNPLSRKKNVFVLRLFPNPIEQPYSCSYATKYCVVTRG